MKLRIIGIVLLSVVMNNVYEKFVVFPRNTTNRHKQITNIDDTTKVNKMIHLLPND
ncbi:hypothetical protein I4U23_022000 [Adineta vaga]|nr:hypothetical protein I4U23_022000 [Adineta vaga]